MPVFLHSGPTRAAHPGLGFFAARGQPALSARRWQSAFFAAKSALLCFESTQLPCILVLRGRPLRVLLQLLLCRFFCRSRPAISLEQALALGPLRFYPGEQRARARLFRRPCLSWHRPCTSRSPSSAALVLGRGYPPSLGMRPAPTGAGFPGRASCPLPHTKNVLHAQDMLPLCRFLCRSGPAFSLG